MTAAASYRLSLRLYVVFSVLMAVSAAASGLLLLYLARPFITALGKEGAHATVLLFAGAGGAGALAAVAGLLVGVSFAGRIRGIVRKAEALSPPAQNGRTQTVTDELGALDAAVGRLTLSMDQFVRDSDILGRLPEGMLLLRQPGSELLSFNATAESLLGVGLAAFQGRPLLDRAGLFPRERGNDALARVLDQAPRDGAVQQVEVGATTAAGRAVTLEVTVQEREWDGSTAIVVLFRDASQKQRIREEIRRADQLAFLGGLAARVAHEIRTPLSTIRGLLELLQADLPGSGSHQAYMTRIIQAVDRQDRLVENLLTLSNPEPEACEAIAMPGLLEDVVNMLPPDPRIRLIKAADAKVPPVWGDAFRLSEVFTNLIKNAMEATPPDGVVEVRVASAEPRSVHVSVRNTGAGIPPAIRARIFQPFFTTKSRGTGLGLAIARQIVEGHRGRLEVESDGVSETTFVVELPTAEPVAAAAR